MIEVLVKAGADINSKTDDGRTPLYQAAFRGHPHCVEKLLSLGADRSLGDADGKTPADVTNKAEVTELLTLPVAKKTKVDT